MVRTESALVTNEGKTVISADNSSYYVLNDAGEPVAVEGGASAVDSIIKGSMNYFVAGIEVEND